MLNMNVEDNVVPSFHNMLANKVWHNFNNEIDWPVFTI